MIEISLVVDDAYGDSVKLYLEEIKEFRAQEEVDEILFYTQIDLTYKRRFSTYQEVRNFVLHLFNLGVCTRFDICEDTIYIDDYR